MIGLSFFAAPLFLVGTGMQAAGGYSGEPILSSSAPYRVLTYSVTVSIDSDAKGRSTGTATVDSTTVYRNQGGAGSASVVIPRFASAPGTPDLPITATWDRKALDLQPAVGSVGGDLTGTAPLKAQGTHALRVHFVMPLEKSGYSGNQYKVSYAMDSKAVVGLFVFSFKYTPVNVFDLPTVTPKLGWLVGRNGASVRRADFTPPDGAVSMEFYPNGFKPIGQ